jgi:hypothetical protein
MIILKASGTLILHMSVELGMSRKKSKQPGEEENPASQDKASIYALVNRPSPPF